MCARLCVNIWIYICICTCISVICTCMHIYPMWIANRNVCYLFTPGYWVGALKWQVSFAEYRLFYRAFLQKRPVILRSNILHSILHTRILDMYIFIFMCVWVCVYISIYIYICLICTCIHIYWMLIANQKVGWLCPANQSFGYVNIHICMCVHVYVCVYMYLYMCIYVLDVHVYIYTEWG